MTNPEQPEGQSPAVVPGLGAGLLRFLQSLGQKSEAELYLRVYRELPKGRFALIVPTPNVLRWHAGTLVEQLRFLCDLDLHPTLVLNGLEEPSEEILRHFRATLAEVGLEPMEREPVSLTEDVGSGLEGRRLVVSSIDRSNPRALIDLAGALMPHKTLFLRTRGGLGPHRAELVELAPGHLIQNTPAGIGSINLRSDANDWAASPLLDRKDSKVLALSKDILEGPAGERPRATVSVASPFAILRELFTVSGEGTLIKLGAAIRSFEGYGGVDQTRLRELLEESFGRAVSMGFFERTPVSVHLEKEYRGVALVEQGARAAFLSKFAVLPVARGEGLGQDLWWTLSKNERAIYWRSRPNNPINNWYRAVCDGMHKTDTWNVYWRGVGPELLQTVIADALSRPEDFES